MNYPLLNLDLLSPQNLANTLQINNIDIVVNMIGLTNVEKCQKDPVKAFFLNSELPGTIAKGCEISKTKFIHISTDHFFDDEDILHSEEDKVSLLNIYAESKFNGEKNVLTNNPNALVCRTNFFGYGPPHKDSFSDWIIKSIQSRKKITLYNDVYITPVDGSVLVNIANKLVQSHCHGIYNICASEKITKYDFGLLLSKKLNISPEYICSGSILDRVDLVKRPKSMSLSNKKVFNDLGILIGNISDQISNIKLNSVIS